MANSQGETFGMADIILSGKEIPEDLKEYFEPIQDGSDVFEIPTQPSSLSHYSMWPERLVERMIRCSTKAGDTVLDCFAGSCTTGVVAESLHRKFIGIELGYKEIIKKKMSKIQKRLLL